MSASTHSALTTKPATSSNGIRGLVKQRLIREMIVGVQGSYKIVLVDQPGARILNAAFRMHEMMDQGITLVESITNQRQPTPTFPAIYFVAPTQQNIDLIIKDFEASRRYASAHLFFTTSCPKAMMTKLGANKNVLSSIKSFVDLQIDFHAIEPLVFSLDLSRDLVSFFGSTFSEMEVNNVAIRLLNVIRCTGETKCAIRYQLSTAATKLAQNIQQKINTETEMNAKKAPASASFQPIGDSGSSSSVPPMLLILDRSIDMISPFLHDLGLQSMLYDMLGHKITNNIFEFETTDNGKPVVKPCPIDEEDDIYVKFRHKHIMEVMKSATELQEALIRDFPAVVKAEKNSRQCTESELAEATRTLGKYRSRKNQISLHWQIAEKLNKEFKNQTMDQMIPLEQTVATGFDSHNTAVSAKDIQKQVYEVIKDSTSRFSPDAKNRLALLFATCSKAENLNDIKTVCTGNCTLDNTQLQALNVFEPWAAKKQKYRTKAEKPLHAHTARYDPAIKKIVEELVDGKLSTADFPFADETMAKKIEAAVAAEATKRQAEAKKKQSKFGVNFGAASTLAGSGAGDTLDLGHGEIIELSSAQRIFVFMVGGITHIERRGIYELAKRLKREIIVGGTSELDVRKFPTMLASVMP